MALSGSSAETRSPFYLQGSLHMVAPSLQTMSLGRSLDLIAMGRLSSQSGPRVELE
jgi:hypothetical protein